MSVRLIGIDTLCQYRSLRVQKGLSIEKVVIGGGNFELIPLSHSNKYLYIYEVELYLYIESSLKIRFTIFIKT